MRNTGVFQAPDVDVPEMDADHQLLCQVCDRLREAIASDAPLGDVEPLLDELVRRTQDHFSNEEREMRECGYSHYAWHARQHRAAADKVIAFERRILNGDRQAAGELLEFLSGWLDDHIGIADRMLAAHLRNRRRAAAVRPA